MAFQGQGRYPPPQQTPYGAGHPLQPPFGSGHPPQPPYGAGHPPPYMEHPNFNQGPHNHSHPVNMYNADPYHPAHHQQGMYNESNQAYAPEYNNQVGGNPVYNHQENYGPVYEYQQTIANLPPPPRPHVNPRFIPPENETSLPPRLDDTRIPRDPYPGYSKDDNRGTHNNEDIYDPSFPTLSSSLNSSQPLNRVTPSPANTSSLNSYPTQGGHNVSQNTNNNRMSSSNTPTKHNPRMRIVPQTPVLEHFVNPHRESIERPDTSSVDTELNKPPKIHIMTGVVTQLQPGAFGMISDEIFFQDSCVSGPLPKVGDKVVVEAEPVHGMPFKYNAKKVTKLDMDLVRDETHEGHFSLSNTDKNLDHPQLEPLPKMPESLNLPKHSLGKLSEFIQSSTPLKSILKRNPPPPPVISATPPQTKTPFKPTLFKVNLSKESPKLLPVVSEYSQEFAEYTFVQQNPPHWALGSPQITRLLPPSPSMQIDDIDWQIRNSGNRSPSSLRIDQSDRLHLGNLRFGHQARSRSISPSDKLSKRTLRGRPTSRSPLSCNRKRLNERSRSRSNSLDRSRRNGSISRTRERRKSGSCSRDRVRRKSRSTSYDRVRRKSRSTSRDRVRRKSRSTSRDRVRRKSRSTSRDRVRRKSRSTSRDRVRRKSRSTSRNRGRRKSRSKSRDRVRRRSRSTSRIRGRMHNRSSLELSSINRRLRSSSSQSSLRSVSPVSVKEVYDRNKTHGIVLEKVSSSLFPKLHQTTQVDPTTEYMSSSKIKSSNLKPMPIKFQINNSSKTASSASIVPNPTFKSGITGINSQQITSHAKFNIHKNSGKTPVHTQAKPKKAKEQEPAFKIVNKISQAKVTTPQISRQTTVEIAANELLKNTENISQLKRTIQKDLQELRVVQNSAINKEASKPPALNLNSVQQLKETVKRDLHELKAASSVKPVIETPLPNIEKLKESVQQGLRDLRSKFDSHKQKVSKEPSQTSVSGTKPDDSNQNVTTPIVTRILPEALPPPEILNKNTNIQIVNQIINNTPEVRNDFDINHLNQDKERLSKIHEGLSTDLPKVVDKLHTVTKVSNKSSVVERVPIIKQSKVPNPKPFVNIEPINETLERLKYDIHQQRLADEEHRLRSIGDMAGLQQMYYLEDRRRRRQEERKLSKIRLLETQFKREKNFGELAKLRNEYGPSEERFQHEQELRRIRLEEQQQESRLSGQAEAIKRQELDYQEWLQSEAMSRSREIERANRGLEGRVKRRRTPSPQTDNSNHRSYGNERNRGEPWIRETNMMAYREESFPMEGPPQGHFYQDFEYHQRGNSDEHFISRAIDDVERRHDDLVQREMENQHRLEIAERRRHADNFNHGNDHRREEFGRFCVRRRSRNSDPSVQFSEDSTVIL